MARKPDLQTDLLAAFRWIDGHADVYPFRGAAVAKVVGVESRGFILGGAVARELGAGFVAIRKQDGLFPGEKLERPTNRDYRGRELKLRIQRDSVSPGHRVILVDDWVETGSQARTARGLVEACGGEFIGVSIIVDQLPDGDSRSEFGDFHAVISAAAFGASSESLASHSARRVDTNFLSEIIRAIKAKPAPAGMSTKVIAIDGLGGAGKSTLAARLAKELGGAQVLPTDDFASWDNPLNWWPRLVEEALEPLSRNKTARYRRSDWGNSGREEWGEVKPAEHVVLEGVSASREAFQPFLTYSIWIDTPRDLRLRRGLDRDGEDARAQWEKWMVEEDDYVNRERPQERADLVLPGDQNLWRTTQLAPEIANDDPEVREMLDEIRVRLLGLLEGKLVGLYLYGSLVVGDFDLELSDLDLLAALSSEVGERELRAIKELHDELVRDYPAWNNRIEVAYVSTSGLRTFKSQASTVAIISPGEPLHLQEAEPHWLIDWYLVREYAVTLFGPPPRTLIEDVSSKEFLQAVQEYLKGRREWVEGRRTRGSQNYAVLTICRGLYTLQHGQQTSKKRAALWAQSEFPDWAALIRDAVVPPRDGPASEARYRDTVRFVEFAIGASEQRLT